MQDFLGKILVRRFYLNPVFIVGQGRSGTTALRKALGLHPGLLSNSYESHLISDYANIIDRYKNKGKDYIPQSTMVLENDLLKSVRKQIFESVFGNSYGFRKLFYYIRAGKKRVSKLNNWVASIFPDIDQYQGLLHLYPGAKFIYITRNPIWQINSSMKHSCFSGADFKIYCDEWVQHVKKYNFLLKSDNALTVKHSELIKQPRIVLEQIFNLIPIEYSQEPLNFLKGTLVHSLNFDTKEEETKQYFMNRENPWERWPEEFKNILVEKCGVLMSELGYSVEDKF